MEMDNPWKIKTKTVEKISYKIQNKQNPVELNEMSPSSSNQEESVMLDDGSNGGEYPPALRIVPQDNHGDRPKTPTSSENSEDSEHLKLVRNSMGTFGKSYKYYPKPKYSNGNIDPAINSLNSSLQLAIHLASQFLCQVREAPTPLAAVRGVRDLAASIRALLQGCVHAALDVVKRVQELEKMLSPMEELKKLCLQQRSLLKKYYSERRLREQRCEAGTNTPPWCYGISVATQTTEDLAGSPPFPQSQQANNQLQETLLEQLRAKEHEVKMSAAEQKVLSAQVKRWRREARAYKRKAESLTRILPHLESIIKTQQRIMGNSSGAPKPAYTQHESTTQVLGRDWEAGMDEISEEDEGHRDSKGHERNKDRSQSRKHQEPHISSRKDNSHQKPLAPRSTKGFPLPPTYPKFADPGALEDSSGESSEGSEEDQEFNEPLESEDTGEEEDGMDFRNQDVETELGGYFEDVDGSNLFKNLKQQNPMPRDEHSKYQYLWKKKRLKMPLDQDPESHQLDVSLNLSLSWPPSDFRSKGNRRMPRYDDNEMS